MDQNQKILEQVHSIWEEWKRTARSYLEQPFDASKAQIFPTYTRSIKLREHPGHDFLEGDLSSYALALDGIFINEIELIKSEFGYELRVIVVK